MVMRGRDDRRTTSSREMTTLTAIPISTFQMMVRKNVSDIRRRSIHARILCRTRQPSCSTSLATPRRYVLPVELRVVGELGEQGEDDEADAVCAGAVIPATHGT